jgi:beta-phosphoglucomutase-like phosphatase (HAD superfamily)
MIRGVLFDMDGVLVDSEEFMCEAAVRMFAEKGLTVTKEDFDPFVGMGENRYLGGVAEKYGAEFDLEKDKPGLMRSMPESPQENCFPCPVCMSSSKGAGHVP